ncbi:GNAT family N-acetyltransferase [Candidatus Micrarchaeota archaeon]|nr:GNAT family N-acetyltransferase [Candidatus Micrarchaeota archaeon]
MISIRLVRSGEIDEAKKFIRSIFPRAMIQINDDDTLLLAETKKKIVGFAHLLDDGEKIIFQGIGVHKSMRGAGVGTMLIEHSIEMFDESDRPIYLKVKVMNPAVDLYQRYGFFIQKFGTTYLLVRKPNN